jgi:hypothetical protein
MAAVTSNVLPSQHSGIWDNLAVSEERLFVSLFVYRTQLLGGD